MRNEVTGIGQNVRKTTGASVKLWACSNFRSRETTEGNRILDTPNHAVQEDSQWATFVRSRISLTLWPLTSGFFSLHLSFRFSLETPTVSSALVESESFRGNTITYLMYVQKHYIPYRPFWTKLEDMDRLQTCQDIVNCHWYEKNHLVNHLRSNSIFNGFSRQFTNLTPQRKPVQFCVEKLEGLARFLQL